MRIPTLNLEKHRGFSLLEILITLILTTVGILGVVAMQSRSIQYTQDAVERNTAIMLSEQLIGVMRANACALYDKVPPAAPMAQDLKSSSLFYTTGASDGCTGDTAATTRATAQRDAWITELETTLPSADYSVCRSSTPKECDGEGSMLEIQIFWQGRDDYCDGDCSFYTRVEI